MGEITDLKGDIQLNKSRIQIVNMLENQVKKLRETYDGKNIKNLFDETNKLVKLIKNTIKRLMKKILIQ